MLLGGIAAPRNAGADQVEHALRGLYFGVGVGWADISIPGRSFTMEGIDFSNISSSEDNAGYRLDAGWSVNKPHRDTARRVHARQRAGDFRLLRDPRRKQGRGRRKSRSTAIPLTLKIGGDVGPVRVFATGGTLLWRAEYDTRFYLPSGETQSRTLRKVGGPVSYTGSAHPGTSEATGICGPMPR